MSRKKDLRCPICNWKLISVKSKVSRMKFGEKQNKKRICPNPNCSRDSKLKEKVR